MVAKAFAAVSTVAVSAEQFGGRAANSELAATGTGYGTGGLAASVCYCHSIAQGGSSTGEDGTNPDSENCVWVDETGVTYTEDEITDVNKDLYRDKTDQNAALEPVTSENYNATSGSYHGVPWQTGRTAGQKWLVGKSAAGKQTGAKRVVKARQYNLCCDDARRLTNSTHMFTTNWRYSVGSMCAMGSCLKSGCDQS